MGKNGLSAADRSGDADTVGARRYGRWITHSVDSVRLFTEIGVDHRAKGVVGIVSVVIAFGVAASNTGWGSDRQILLDHVLVELADGAVRNDPAGLHHVEVVGDAEREVEELLHEQDGHASASP